MVSASTLLCLLLGISVSLTLADPFDDEFYRNIRSPSMAGLEETHSGPPVRDSWRKIVVDMAAYLKILSDNSDAIEKNLQDLWVKVDKNLDLKGKENYNLWYAKKLIDEQRDVIESLQSGQSKALSYDELLRRTDEYVRPSVAYDGTGRNTDYSGVPDFIKGRRQGEHGMAVENEQLYEALKNLKNL